MHCDFCSSREVIAAYDVPDFITLLGTRSVGAWAACAECAALIEQEDRAGLLDRSLSTAPVPTGDATMTRIIAELHRRFFALQPHRMSEI